MARITRKFDDSAGARGSDAFALMKLIAQVEGKSFDRDLDNAVDRQWILDTYRQCRVAALGKEPPGLIQLIIQETPVEPPNPISADTAASTSAACDAAGPPLPPRE